MEGFDLSVLSDYALLLLVPGIVQTAKKLGLGGNGNLILSILLGTGFVGLAQAIAQGLVPEVALPWIKVGVAGLGGGLAASGYYDLFKKFTGKE